jgi:O-antigen ligase
MRRIGSILVCAVVVLAPLPFGSAEPFWGGVWCSLLGVALLAAPSTVNAHQRIAVWLILLVAAAWCLVVAIQYAPLDSQLRPGPGWDEAGRLLTVNPKIAAYGQIPIAAVVPPLALVLAMLVGLAFASEPNFTPTVFGCVANAGIVYAAYGIFAELTNPNMLLWRQKTAYIDFVTGTFVNHNTAATFFGSIAIIWYARFLREIRRRFDLVRWRDVRYVIRKLSNLESTQIRYALVFFVLLATTFMTRSRAGSLLTLVALCIVTWLYFNQALRTISRGMVAAIVLSAFAALAIALAGGRLASEIETRGLYDVARADAWTSEFKIVRDYPWLGTGLGTFPSVFSSYRTPEGGVWGIFDHAHSTPIELLAEMGIPFGMLVFCLWTALLAFLLRGSLRRAGGRQHVIAGTAIFTLGTLHSVVDFSLQIPGFAIVFGVLVGASLGQALMPAERSPGDAHGTLSGLKYKPDRSSAGHNRVYAGPAVSGIPPAVRPHGTAP